MGKVMLLLVAMVVILLHFCNAGKDLNVTYVKEMKTWVQAKAYCQVHGGVLENNITVIKQHYNGKQGVWIGTYMSPWVGYFGCSQLNTTKLQVHTVENEDFFECQQFCPLSKYEYFSVQGTKCFCVDDTVQKVDFYKCMCTNCKYFKIYKQNIDPDRRGTSDENGTGLCIAAECIEKNLIITSEDCSESYTVLCDNSTGVTSYKSQLDATTQCGRHNSSIKWLTKQFCGSEPKATGQHWTSITRKILHLSMNEPTNAILSPEMCGIGKSKNETKDLQLSFVNCNMKCSFFCRFVDEEEMEITGIVIGVIAAIVTVIVIVVIVLMYRRKRSTPTFDKDNQKVKKSSKSELDHDRANNEIVYHEIDTESPNYSLATAGNFKRDSEEDPNSTKMSGDYDKSNASAERELHVDIKQADGHGNVHDNRNSQHNENRSPVLLPNNTPGQTLTNVDDDHNSNTIQSASINKDINSGDYCLATPVVEEDEYATNKNYDHLHNVKKKEDNSGHNVYDHLPETLEGDVTYDHSNFTASRSADDNYDYFNIQLKQE